MLYHRESESRGAPLHPKDSIRASRPLAIGRYWRKGARWTVTTRGALVANGLGICGVKLVEARLAGHLV